MKKIFAVLIMTFGLVSASFAVDFTVGGNLNAGGTFSDDANYSGFTLGAGAFFNLDLAYGFGFQIETNASQSKIEFSANNVSVTEKYNVVDVPVMLWWNGFFGRLGAGIGGGINLGTAFDDANNTSFSVGAAAGADIIFYFNNHIGLVIGAHGVFDFTPLMTVTESKVGADKTDYTVNTADWNRKSIYGNAGVCYRF